MGGRTPAGAATAAAPDARPDDPPSDDDVRLERRLGWLRVIGGVAILASIWQNPSSVPDWVAGMFVAGGLLFLVTGVITLAFPVLQTRRRACNVLGFTDALTISMLVPFGISQDSPYLFLVFTLLAVVGGVRTGRLGVLRNLVIVAPFETTRLIVGQSLYGNQSVEDTAIAILVATGVGVLVSDVATSGRQARRTAARERATSQRDRVRARRLAWEVEVLEDVVRVAGTGPTRPALGRAVARTRERLDVQRVQVLTVGPSDALVVTASSNDDPPVGAVVEMLPGGPRDRAMSLGSVAAATHDDLASLSTSGAARGSVVAAPLPIDGRLLGVLVCESRAGDLLHRRDAALVERLGRGLAPFVARVTDVGRHANVEDHPSTAASTSPAD